MGKSGSNATFNNFLIGLGWPWVGAFVGFITIITCFPTQHNLINRKHPATVVAIYLGYVRDMVYRAKLNYISKGVLGCCTNIVIMVYEG